MPNIGLIGRARSGKDTAGEWLVRERGYSRVAFADPLKAAALTLDPLIEQIDMAFLGVDEHPDVRLSELVREYGWEEAKEAPEVRRILQELGAAVRALDPDFWLRLALHRATDLAETTGRPTVITDVRYPNEVMALRRTGWHLIYIDRSDAPQLDHESERLTEAEADFVVRNNGSLADLRCQMESAWQRVNDAETRRERNRSC